MLRQMFYRMGLLALAGVGLLLIAGPAKAQQGWPLQGSNWSYYYGRTAPSSYGSYSPSYYPRYENPMPPSTSYYSPVGSDYANGPLATAKRPARVNLRVPADAKIWFDGSTTNQTGTVRSFESPPLPGGREYAYQVRIQWQRDGKDVSETRKIIVHAGDEIDLSLGTSPGSLAAR